MDQRARTVTEIYGLPPLAGLQPLPHPQGLPVPYALLRRELARTIKRENALAGKPAAKGFPVDALQDMLERIEAEVPVPALDAFSHERAKISAALAGLPFEPPNLDRSECQLAWASAIAHLHFEGAFKDGFLTHPVVKTVADSEYVDRLLMEFGYNAGVSAKVVLGAPGTWFYHSPSDKVINLDLAFMLVAGGGRTAGGGVQSHADVIFHHEDGHNRLSRSYPPSMQAIWKEMRALHWKGGEKIPEEPGMEIEPLPEADPNSKLTRAELKHLKLLRYEFDQRFALYNAAEDNCVNEYATRQSNPEKGGTLTSHMGDSLNVFCTLINDLGGDLVEADDKPAIDNAAARYSNLQHAVNMCYFMRNHALPDTPEGWESLGVKLDWITDFSQAEPARNPQAAFTRLREIMERIEQTQPRLRDKMLGSFRSHENTAIYGYDNYAKYLSDKRGELMDEIFRDFAEPYLQEMRQEAEQQYDQQAANGQKGQPSGQPGAGAPGAGNGGQGMPGSGAAGSGAPGQGQGGGTSGLRVEGEDGEVEVDALPNGTPQGNRDRDQKARAAKNGGAGEDSKPGKSAPTTDELRNRKINGNGKGKKSGRQEAGKEADKQRSLPKNLPTPNPQQQGGGVGSHASPFDGLQLDDGRTYEEMQNDPAYRDTVEVVKSWLDRIAEKSQKPEIQLSEEEYQFTPPDNNWNRLDKNRLTNLAKQAAAGKVTMNDFAWFQEDEHYAHATQGDFCFYIDGSGSMNGTPLEIATKMCGLVYDAGKEARYRTWANLWGSRKPFTVLTPEMPHEEAVENMDAVINGMSSGTDLAPSIPHMLQLMLDHTEPSTARRGFTHNVILSDGGIYDVEDTTKALQAYLDASPHATLDVVIAQEGGSLRDAIEAVQPQYPHQQIKIYKIDAPNEIPLVFTQLMETRAELCGRQESIETNRWIRRVEDAREDVQLVIH